MKKLFNIAALLFLVTSCSKDDDSVTPAPAAPEIPADKKYISTIDRWENDISFAYAPDKKVQYIYFGTDTMFSVSYEGERIDRIILFSNVYESYIYEFGYNPAGSLTGYFRYTTTNHELVSYQALVYNAETNSYNDWLYMYDNGSVKRVISGDLDRTLVYDTTKKGAFANMDQNLIRNLMMINRDIILWPAYIGKFPCKEVVQQQGVLEIENTYDSQGFIAHSHMDSTLNNLNSIYTYIEL